MKTLSLTWLVGALSLSTLVPQAIADDPIIVELRMRKSDVIKRGPNEGPLLELRDASIISDGGFSSYLAERADNSTLSQIEEIVQKRQSLNDLKGDSCKKTPKCYYSSMVYSEDTEKCEMCPSGEKANAAGDKCEKPKTKEEEKEEGKCPDGKKLDPKVEGQDELTEDPKCVDKDNNECPKGQTMSSAQKDKPSKCAPDDDPDKKCDKEKEPDTEVFKEIGPDGKMKSSCRSTKEKEKKKRTQIKEKLEPIRNKYMSKETNDREKKNRIRARRGACLALGAMSFISTEDMNKITDEEISGLQEPDFDGPDPIPGVDLEDYMVTFNPKLTVVVPGMETAGFGGAIVKLIMSIFKAGKAISKAASAFKNAAKSTGGARMAKLRKPTKNTSASKGAVQAAKKSEIIKKIAKSDSFLDCVATGAITAAELAKELNDKGKREERPAEGQRKWNIDSGSFTLTIDLDAEKTDQHPISQFDSDRAIVVVADESEDAGSNGNIPRIVWQTWADGYHRNNRVNYEYCTSLAGNSVQNNAWTLVQVWGGCCTFYNGDNCEADTGLFSMTDREDGELDGGHNDAISSFWCTFDAGCSGAPGV